MSELYVLPKITVSNQPDEYERFVQQVIAELGIMNPEHQREFVGIRSQRKIKVDVSFELTPLGGARTIYVVECKCYNHRVPVDDIEEFHSKLDDIGAHKGILITTVGFQEGAIKTAKGRGIALALLTKESQPGELRFIVNSAQPTQSRSVESDALLQGNFKGLFGDYDVGLRFDSVGQLYGVLVMNSRPQN